VSDLPVITLVPSKEICSFGECIAPPGHGILQLLSWKCLLCSCLQGFSKITFLKTYIRWLDFVIYGQNMSMISFMPFDDLLKLIKTPSRLRIGLGKNNNGYPTVVENRLLDVSCLHWILVVKESGKTNSWEGIMEVRNKFSVDVFSSKVDEHIVLLWEFVWRGGIIHGKELMRGHQEAEENSILQDTEGEECIL